MKSLPTGTMSGLTPVTNIDGRIIGTGQQVNGDRLSRNYKAYTTRFLNVPAILLNFDHLCRMILDPWESDRERESVLVRDENHSEGGDGGSVFDRPLGAARSW